MSTDAAKREPTLHADSHGRQERAARRDSLRDSVDSTASSDETRSDSSPELSPSVVSDDLRQKAFAWYPPDQKPISIRAHHRSTGLLPAILARISSITSRGTRTTLPSPVPSSRLAKREVVHNGSTRSADIGSAARPSNQDNRAVQAPSPSHSSDPSTAPVAVREHQDAHHSLDNDQRRQRARRGSSVSFVSSLGPSETADAPVGKERKMHQTSSRLLRMTDDDRPFTRVRQFHFLT
jgi:hypothetical protein